MPGDAGEKTEPATPRRRQEARERGQIARSTDLGAALLLLGGLLCLRWFAPRMIAALMQVMRDNLSLPEAAAGPGLDVIAVLTSVGLLALAAAGPILAGLVVVSLLAGFMQVGFLFTWHPVQPKLDKLNPINGFRRLFSTRTLVQAGMNVLKLALVGLVAWSAIRGRRDEIMLALGVGGWQQLVVYSRVLYDVGLQLAVVLLLIALLDYAWHRYKHERDLRMTREEVKEELRRMEGDPVIKQRRRRMQFAAALQRIRSAVPTADVVVTNPTEYAVAIKYDPDQMAAPRVVAKGRNFMARKIREIAIAHQVPIVERPPLAQALFRLVEVGQEVPEQLYRAVAEILAYVYELSGRVPKRRSASAA